MKWLLLLRLLVYNARLFESKVRGNNFLVEQSHDWTKHNRSRMKAAQFFTRNVLLYIKQTDDWKTPHPSPSSRWHYQPCSAKNTLNGQRRSFTEKTLSKICFIYSEDDSTVVLLCSDKWLTFYWLRVLFPSVIIKYKYVSQVPVLILVLCRILIWKNKCPDDDCFHDGDLSSVQSNCLRNS